MEKMIKNLKHDFPAGIVVFLVAMPLCLGIALASDAPLYSGVIAGMVGGIVIGLLSNSQLSVSGPAAGLSAIVFMQIRTLGAFPTFLLAVVIAGVFQILLGIAKTGTIADYFPSNVIKGMLTAIGILIIMKQIAERSPILRGMLESGEIGIVCGMYNVGSGRVDFYDDGVTMFRHKIA